MEQHDPQANAALDLNLMLQTGWLEEQREERRGGGLVRGWRGRLEWGKKGRKRWKNLFLDIPQFLGTCTSELVGGYIHVFSPCFCLLVRSTCTISWAFEF